MGAYPPIFINKEKKQIVLANYRVGTGTFFDLCPKKGFHQIWEDGHQDESFERKLFSFLENNNEIIDDYQVFLFVRNPYHRFLSFYAGLIFLSSSAWLKATDALSFNYLVQIMKEEDRQKFLNIRKKAEDEGHSWDTYFNTLKIFLKYFPEYYQECGVARSDGHLLPQTSNQIYTILNKATFIKLDEGSAEKTSYLNELFGIDVLPNSSRKTHILANYDKKLFITDEMKQMVNRIYYSDFAILGYEMEL